MEPRLRWNNKLKLPLLNSNRVNDILSISVSMGGIGERGLRKMLKDILKILENDARASARQIATMTGLTVAEVKKLIAQAEKDRAILKYKTLVNWDKVGEEQVWALIELRVAPQKDVGFDAIAERIQLFPQARSVFLISGTYDLQVLVVGKTNREIADFVSQQLSHIEGVQETVTQFVLKRYKEDGEVMESGEAVKRQSVIL
jgi:DNA-binding Lrp family transcriptional regulator